MVYRAVIIGKGHRGVIGVIHSKTKREMIAEAVKPLKDPGLFAHLYRCDDTGSPSKELVGIIS